MIHDRKEFQGSLSTLVAHWSQPLLSLQSSEVIQDVLQRAKAREPLLKLISASVCIKKIAMKQVPDMTWHHFHSHHHVTQFKNDSLRLDTITFCNTKRCTPDLGRWYSGPGNMSALEVFPSVRNPLILQTHLLHWSPTKTALIQHSRGSSRLSPWSSFGGGGGDALDPGSSPGLTCPERGHQQRQDALHKCLHLILGLTQC